MMKSTVLVLGVFLMVACGKNNEILCANQQAQFQNYINGYIVGVTTHTQIAQHFIGPIQSNVSGGVSTYRYTISADDTGAGVACGQALITENNGLFGSGVVGNCDVTHPPTAAASTGIDCSIR